MLRSVAAVFAGFVVLNAAAYAGGLMLAQLIPLGAATAPPPGYAAAHLAVRVLAGFLAGLAAAHVAPHHRLPHAAALAGLMLALAAVTIGAPLPESRMLPAWYLPVLAVAAPLAALAGGWLRAARATPAAATP